MLRNTLTLWLDTALLVVTCALMVTSFTGIPLHEWIGVALIPALLLHVLLQWPWIANRTRRLPEPRSWRHRVNYTLNFALFVTMIAVMQSGFAISRVALPVFLPDWFGDRRWGQLHKWSSYALLVVIGLHISLNWGWIKGSLRKRFT